MAAVMAKGTTTLSNAASEPHVQDLAHFLVAMGARIEGIGSNQMTVHGGLPLHGTTHRIGPDHIEVGSFIGLAAVTRSEITIERAGVEPERVGYINAHGTSTPLGDAAETKAIKDVFGKHAYDLAVSSTKSVMGHCFGAAGAIEAMMCVLAVHEGVLPPTINYRNPDPVCDLDYVPNESRKAEVDVALSNAMGLGGHNACVLIGRV